MLRIWKAEPERWRSELSAWARSLSERSEVLAVVLFGSLAQGRATAMSDADILIVLQESALPFAERMVVYKPQGLGIGVEVFPYTLEEARQSWLEGWGMVRPALQEGVVLFERPGALAQVKSLGIEDASLNHLKFR